MAGGDAGAAEVARPVAVEARHVAAVLFREQQAQQQETKHIQDLRRNSGGEGMYGQMAEGREEVIEDPNFYDIDRAVGARKGEEIRLTGKESSLKDDGKTDEANVVNKQVEAAQKKQETLEQNKKMLQEIYDGNPSKDTVIAVGKIFARIPGFYTAVASELKISPDLVKQILESGSFYTNTDAASSKLRQIVEGQLKLDGTKQILAKFLNQAKYAENIDVLDGQIGDLEITTEDEAKSIADERELYIKGRTFLNSLTTPAEVQKIETLQRGYDRVVSILQDSSLPAIFRLTSIDINSINNLLSIFEQQKSSLTSSRISPEVYKQELENLKKCLEDNNCQPDSTTGLTNIDLYRLGKNSQRGLSELDSRSRRLTTEKNRLANLRGERKKTLESYENGVNTTLEKTVKKVWNDIVLKEGGENAKLEADEKIKQAELAKTHGEKVKALVDGFLQLSLREYNTDGSVKRWNDKLIKRLVKEDMMHCSPEEMMRWLLKEIIGMRGNLPEGYGTKMDKILSGIFGVDETAIQSMTEAELDTFLSKIDGDVLTDIAKDEIPKLLGFAKSRHYFGDRLRIKRKDAELLRDKYSPDFFEKMLRSQKDFEKAAEGIFGKGILTGGDELLKKLKEGLLGKNWIDFMSKLFFLLAILGAGVSLPLGGVAALASFGLSHSVGAAAGVGAAATASSLGGAGVAAGIGAVSRKAAEH